MFNSIVDKPEQVHFLGRLGRTQVPKSRSTRMDLKTSLLSNYLYLLSIKDQSDCLLQSLLITSL